MHEHRKLNERGISQLIRGYFVGNRAARKVSSTRKSLRIFYFFFFFRRGFVFFFCVCVCVCASVLLYGISCTDINCRLTKSREIGDCENSIFLTQIFRQVNRTWTIGWKRNFVKSLFFVRIFSNSKFRACNSKTIDRFINVQKNSTVIKSK